MKTKNFIIVGIGHFSESFGWDDGLDLREPIETKEEYTFEETPMFLGRYVNVITANEHGGSRYVTLLVRGFNSEDAMEYARMYAERYYPEKYNEDED